ncbi:PilZ domain-containing protein [Sphingomonas sp.]|jgi:hypothetical protein|uniref:PilZ domain-containing protein n=1 Tax=Sphingomonas sp. TaxID=28214 RepID=UPI002DF437FA|nr:PilZ domain-containing protein [Sphingomonas sp.]
MATGPGAADTAPRAANRYKTFLPCAVEQNGTPNRAHILNVSLTGAMIATPETMRPRDWISLQFQSVSYKAVVVWARDHRAGLRFSLPLPQSTLQKLIA